MTTRVILTLVVSAIAVPAQLLILITLWRWLREREFSARLAMGVSTAFLASGTGLISLFSLTTLDLDRHGLVLWAWVGGTALCVGLVSGWVSRRVPLFELLVGVTVVSEAVGFYIGISGGEGGIAGAPLRTLMIAPAAMQLVSYFGASLGYLLFGAGGIDVNVGYEGLVGRRFLLSKSSSALSTVTTISVVGVALGVWLVVISLGVLSGFEGDLQAKIIGAGSHVVIKAKRSIGFALPEGSLERVRAAPGVVAAAPFLEGEVALASQSNYTGGLLYGIDPKRSPEVLSVLDALLEGSLDPLVDEMMPTPPRPEAGDEEEFLPPAPVPSIVIGREMSKALNAGVGDRIRVISPVQETMTPIGMAPKTLDFRVAGIFSIEMYEFDARYAYVSLKSARRFFMAEPGVVSGIQIRADEPERAASVGAGALSVVPRPEGGAVLEALDWQRRNSTLFAALKLERVVAFVVLVFIILVASFSIVNTLTMSVIEKRKEIAILMTMGARRVGVMKVFLVQGMLVGVFGTVFGALAAVFTAFLLEHIGFGIPGDVYYITNLPVHVGAGDVVLVVLAALLIVWDFAVFPALRGSRLEPVEGLRDG